MALALFDDPFRAGLVTAASYGSTLVVGMPAGVLADRRSRKGVMIAAEVVQLTSMLVLAVLLVTDTAVLPLVCLIAFLNGSMFAVFGAASSAALPDLVPRHRLSAALSANEGRDATLSMVGTVVGGALIVVATWAPFAFAALTFATSVVLLTRISTSLRVPEADRTVPGRARFGEVLAGFHVVRSDAVLLRSNVFLAGMGFVLTASFFTVVELFNSRGSTLQAGVVIAIQGAGLLAGSVIAPVLGGRLRPLTAFAIQGTLWTLGLAVIARSPTLLVTGLALAGMWAAVSTGRVSLQSYIADEVPTGLRGRLHSVRFVTSALTTPLGPLAAGAVLSSCRPRPGCWAWRRSAWL